VFSLPGLRGVVGLLTCGTKLLPFLTDAKSSEIPLGVGHGGGLLSHDCQLSWVEDMSSSHTLPGPGTITPVATSGERIPGVDAAVDGVNVIMVIRDSNLLLSNEDNVGQGADGACGTPQGKGIGVFCSCESSFKCRAIASQLISGVHCSVGIATGHVRRDGVRWSRSSTPGVFE